MPVQSSSSVDGCRQLSTFVRPASDSKACGPSHAVTRRIRTLLARTVLDAFGLAHGLPLASSCKRLSSTGGHRATYYTR